METVVEGNDEGKFEESGVAKSSSSLSSPKQIADPVVYKLVRVEGDGRLVPATDDEVMEVEGLLKDEKGEMLIVDTDQTGGCISNEGSSSGMPHLESSEGLSHSGNTEVDAEKLNARLEYIEEMLQKVKQEERLRLAYGSPDHFSAYVIVDSQYSDQHDKLPGIDEKLQSEITLQETVPSMATRSTESQINQSGSVGECSNPPDGLIEVGSSTSVVCASSKPDFSKLQGEICLDNMSIKELHETFKATFGRETTVKDKQWLKRRIAMGLTNSCDVSTTSFVIKDNKLVKKGKDESGNNLDGTITEDPAIGASEIEDDQFVSGKRLRNRSVDYDYGNEGLQTDQGAAKRVRKPTKRYIEELSEVESKENSGRLTTSTKNSRLEQVSPKSHVRPVRNVSLNGRTIVTRLDSLGGSGVQVPYVCRIRRSRPRKNVMALMEFHPDGMGMAATLVKKAVCVHGSQSDNDNGSKILKARDDPEQIQLPLIAETGNNKQLSVVGAIELGQNMELKHVDSSGDTAAPVSTAKGGIRRKHHRAWTLSEVMKLIEGVSRYGAGRWSEIKRLAFSSYSYRTSVDLKDKWRNLLKASFAQTPSDRGMNSRKQASSMPIPAPILLRVRELAEMQAQVPPNLSSGKPAGGNGRSVNDTRSGYL